VSDQVDKVLRKLEAFIAGGSHEALETDTLEIKPVPADSASWKECHKTVCAFLNTRGGIILFGFREKAASGNRGWEFTGYREDAEPKLKELATLFQDRSGKPLDLGASCFVTQIRDFADGRVAVVYVDELRADQKFAFYKGHAYRRQLTGDHKISDADISRQEEYREEAANARELQIVPGAKVADLDVEALNEYIQQLNRPTKVETIKADINAAVPFLERKSFIKDVGVTTLGVLVCGKHPEDLLEFRCHVHGYVDVPQLVAQDKQDIIGNILPLLERSLAYVFRNIQVGVSAAAGGMEVAQYPEEVLRETVNNALAHRDYSVNKQAIIAIKPGHSISIRNPGSFRKHLLIEHTEDAIPLLRIVPEAKARNPKLADVLRVFRKWEGKGIGMATLVNLCLDNRIDLPTYRLYSEEVRIDLNSGELLDQAMKLRFEAFGGHIRKRLGSDLNREQARILAYLIKSQEANARHHYTILLTPDNNHFDELRSLEAVGLISKHSKSTTTHPIYVADPVFLRDDYREELLRIFGQGLSTLNDLQQDCAAILFRHGEYALTPAVTAKTAAYILWHRDHGNLQDLKAFDTFYRKVRAAFNKLEKTQIIRRAEAAKRGYLLNHDYLEGRLF